MFTPTRMLYSYLSNSSDSSSESTLEKTALVLTLYSCWRTCSLTHSLVIRNHFILIHEDMLARFTLSLPASGGVGIFLQLLYVS